MKKQVRLGLMLIAAMMGLASCDHYVCTSGAQFGSSSCTAGSVGLGSTGTGNTTAAFVFLSNGTGEASAIEGYTLNTTTSVMTATANYTPPSTPPEDSGLGMAVAQKQYLYTAFGSTNTIYGWTISAEGILAPVSGSPYTASFASAGSLEFDTQGVITNPAGTLLFIGDPALDSVFVYQIGTGGVLTAVGSPVLIPFPPGNLATDGLGKYLYITDVAGNHTGTKVAAYSIGSGGTLTAVSGSPFSVPMWQVQGEPTGQFLIGTTGQSLSVNGADNDSLYVFSIVQSGATAGAISQVSSVATTYSPFNIAVETNSGGNLVYSFGLNDTGSAFNPAEGFTLSSSGTLTEEASSPYDVGNVGSQGQFDQSGDFLFIYGGVFDVNTVVYTVDAFPVVTGAIGNPIPSGTYGGYWVATDPQ